MSKAWKITLSILSSILILLFLFFTIYYAWPWNKKFFGISTKEFAIPGLDTDFVPQGMCEIDGTDKVLISGYMNDNTPSRFYIVDKSKGVEKYFTLSQAGEDYVGHASGIVSKGSTIWAMSDQYCYRFFLSDLGTVQNGGKVLVIDSFPTFNGADFGFEYDGFLWIGEFYKAKKCETQKSHWLQTRSGEVNPSLVFGFKIDESKALGLYSKIPTRALSIIGECQGMSVTKNGNFVLSCSYGLMDSNLIYYKNVLADKKHDKFIMGKNILDLWYLDLNSMISSMNAPAMSEGVFINNERLYILFESSAKKYKIFNRKRLKNVYSIPINSFE